MELAQRIFAHFSNASRQRKLDLFYSLMRPTPASRVLDLGGEAAGANQPHKQLLDLYEHRENMVLVNLFFPNVKHAAQTLPGLRVMCADGMRLPFADKSFDICYCNAVVEHLSTEPNQRRFAGEIMRVAKSWFVTTPNRWFPFEPHLRLPMVTWLPQRWQHWIGFRYGYLHLRRRYGKGCDRTDLRLLGGRQMRELFPGSRIIRNGVPGWTPTLIAVGGEALATVAGGNKSPNAASAPADVRRAPMPHSIP